VINSDNLKHKYDATILDLIGIITIICHNYTTMSIYFIEAKK
jgi:hypothetical protein